MKKQTFHTAQRTRIDGPAGCLPDDPIVLGVDVGGTHTKVAAFDLGGELLGTRALDLLAHGEGIGTGERLK
ncbi:hypothetical protein [Gordonibacter urolithinfaciens]|uniref:hypothetical protein n=1 Tax=Gordonibacter urolithinfaciens TaxID=1335613 RepID=UPI003AAE16B5